MNLKNTWKLLPYFLKGTIIGFAATIIYSIGMYSYILINGISAGDSFFISFPAMLLMGQYFPSSLIFCLFLYSGIGLFVGLIIGMIKKRK